MEGRGRERKMEGGEGTGGEGRPPMNVGWLRACNIWRLRHSVIVAC